MRCRVAYGNGVISKILSEVQPATQQLHSANSRMELSQSSVPLALTQDETYLMDGILMKHARELLLLLHNITHG